MQYTTRRPINIFSIFLIIIFIFCLSINELKSNSLEYFKLSIDETMKMYKTMNEVLKNNNNSVIGTYSEEQFTRIIIHSKNALSYSYRVQNDDLDKLDRSLFFKDLKKKYNNLFRRGLILLIDCYEEFETDKCFQADKLLREWGNYYTDLRDEWF